MKDGYIVLNIHKQRVKDVGTIARSKALQRNCFYFYHNETEKKDGIWMHAQSIERIEGYFLHHVSRRSTSLVKNTWVNIAKNEFENAQDFALKHMDYIAKKRCLEMLKTWPQAASIAEFPGREWTPENYCQYKC